MAPTPTTVLVSGASVAGPTLAYWLRRYGFEVTVVERTPELRKGLGGHAVDLFGPAVDIAEWMGILPQVQATRTRTPRQVWLAAQLMRLVPQLPAALQRRLASLQGGPARALESITLKQYQPLR